MSSGGGGEELLRLLRERRSVRRFKPEPPPRELIERLLEAATSAPSASNKQPWRFLVVTAPERIAAMAAAVREAVGGVAAHVDPSWRASFEAYGSYFTRFETAPVVIVPLHRPLQLLSHMVEERPEPAARARIAAMEESSGLMGTAMALENLLLAAPALGLGASGMTGPLLAADRLEALLEVPRGWRIAAVVPVGYPDEEPAPTARKPVASVTRWLP